MITVKNLKAINSLVMDEVPFVNYGGCAYYASLLQSRCRELGQFTESGIIALSPPHGADHVFSIISIDDVEYFHDGEVTRPLAESTWRSLYERYSLDETVEITNSNGWNYMFRPKRDLPLLIDSIEAVLGPYHKVPNFDKALVLREKTYGEDYGTPEEDYDESIS